jgi:hypothetical protein
MLNWCAALLCDCSQCSWSTGNGMMYLCEVRFNLCVGHHCRARGLSCNPLGCPSLLSYACCMLASLACPPQFQPPILRTLHQALFTLCVCVCRSFTCAACLSNCWCFPTPPHAGQMLYKFYICLSSQWDTCHSGILPPPLSCSSHAYVDARMLCLPYGVSSPAHNLFACCGSSDCLYKLLAAHPPARLPAACPPGI